MAHPCNVPGCNCPNHSSPVGLGNCAYCGHTRTEHGFTGIPPIVSVIAPPASAIGIDWAWGNYGSPVDRTCELAEVGPRRIPRGSTTAHDCVVKAINAARAGQMEEALGWLAETQCHNPDAKQTILNDGQRAIQYAVRTYGNQVPMQVADISVVECKVDPNSISPGQASTLYVKLNTAAPAPGVTVSIDINSDGSEDTLVTIPTSIGIPTGQSSGTFLLRTQAAIPPATRIIFTAHIAGGTNKSAQLNIR